MNRRPNYLRTYRRRAGLAQRDLAILLGSSDRTRVSRYELNKRNPAVDVALALEIALGVSVRVLFAGRFAELEKLIRKRAALLPPEKAQRIFDRAAWAPSIADGDQRHFNER